MQSMKKILYVITKSNWGGAQRYVFDLATALPKEQFSAQGGPASGWEVAVALGGEGLLKEKLLVAGIRTVGINALQRDVSLAKEVKTLRELMALFKQERPSVVHLNSSKAGGLGALAARIMGVPHIIFTSHGLAYDEDRNVLSRLLIFFSTWATFLLCHTVIVISKNNFERTSRFFGCGKKVRLIYNGLGPLEFLAREEARAHLKLPQNALVIGALGELTWNKNYPVLLRAAGLLKRSAKEFTLCIMGEGQERTFVETLIDEEDVRDRVVLAGFVPEGYRYLKAYDIFVLTSVKEGLPYVLLEAGQAGLPVVASHIPGNEDIVDNKVSGLLFKSKDHHNLATQLKLLLDDSEMRARLGKNLEEQVQKEFSLEKMVSETSALY
ncbi:MAG: glycosyltransferase family 4 protein [Patescibacteria group bacterium]